MAIADLNGDGKPDLAVANFFSNNVSVLLNTTPPGTGTPTFSAATNFTVATGLNPFSVAIADLNGDGKPDLAVANSNSGNVSVLLNITGPVVTTTAGSASYTENQPATAIDSALTVIDTDSANLAGASVQITAGYQNGQDLLACPACAAQGITASFTPATGKLDLTGTVAVANYQTALQSVIYQNTSDNPATIARTVSFQATDSTSVQGNVETRQVAVTAVNDAPAAVADTFPVAANAPTTINAPGVLANDADVDGPSLTAVLVTNAAHGSVVLQPNGGFTYTPNAQYLGADSFTYKPSDTLDDGNAVTVSLSVGGSTLSIDDPTVTEGNAGTKTLTFTVSLSPPSTGPVTVQVQTQDGTATAGPDYVAVSPTTLAFAPGETSKTVAVTVNGDTAGEPNETFRLVLSNVSGAIQARSYGTATIVNDDTQNPRVQLQQANNGAPIPGAYVVTLTANTSSCDAANTIQRIDFGAARNARVQVVGAAPGAPGGPPLTPGAPAGTPGNFSLTANAQSVTLFVLRQAPGDFKVDMAIVDTCGGTSAPFRTFVGGGAGVP